MKVHDTMTPCFERFLGSLDIGRLELPRITNMKLIAQCPACAEAGQDSKGEHLVIFPGGKFGCVVHPKDKAHRRRIYSLVGLKGSSTHNSAQTREMRREFVKLQMAGFAKQKQIKSFIRYRETLFTQYAWEFPAMLADSPQARLYPNVAFRYEPRHFLASLFLPGHVLWTGDVMESGTVRHAHRWRSCAEWCQCPHNEIVGPMVSPAVWKPGSISRMSEQVMATPYVVIDFDGVNGVKPSTPREFAELVRSSLATVRWLREKLGWQLAAILWSGNVGIHAWFHSPPPDVLASLQLVEGPLGIDPGLIGHPEHPCRLPGHPHKESGHLSRILWLQEPGTIPGDRGRLLLL